MNVGLELGRGVKTALMTVAAAAHARRLTAPGLGICHVHLEAYGTSLDTCTGSGPGYESSLIRPDALAALFAETVCVCVELSSEPIERLMLLLVVTWCQRLLASANVHQIKVPWGYSTSAQSIARHSRIVSVRAPTHTLQ